MTDPVTLAAAGALGGFAVTLAAAGALGGFAVTWWASARLATRKRP